MLPEKNNQIVKVISAYSKKLSNFIRTRVKSDADAEDILQDVWFQLSNVINSEPIEQTGAWLYRVARNKIIDKHKKKKEVLWENYSDDEGDESINLKELLLTDVNTAEGKYMRTMFWEQLFIALDELPHEQKQVFIWHELEELSFQQIADLTGENASTLVSRKRYAVLHLRKRLKNLYKEIINY